MPPAAASPPEQPRRHVWSWLLLAGILGLFYWWQSSAVEAVTEVDYSTVERWVSEGQVRTATFEGDVMTGELVAADPATGLTKFHARLPPEDKDVLGELRDHNAKITFANPEPAPLVRILLGLLPWVVIIGVWVWLSRRARSMMVAGGPLGGFLKRGRRFEKSKTSVTFADVAGLASAKRDLAEVVQFLKEPERFAKLGASVPRGVLLVGPPGTGKTLLARAVAGEADVPFYSISAAEFVEMFVGVGAARVRELFVEAKRDSPSIVFIDEIDAVGRARGAGIGGGHDEREQTLNQLLSEMDGFERSDLTVVIAATNRPDVLDAALLRPGRFDRRVVVDLPEAGARRAILALHTQHKPLADDVDLTALAAGTAGFSGADLANLANEAALHATRRRAEKITAQDFSAAFDKIVLGDPREAKLGETEKQRVAVHESGHALLAWASPEAEPLKRVSILPRGMALGATQQVPPEDRHLHTRKELDARLLVLLGGFAAERLVLGDVSTGAEHDLREATRLASKMVAHYGMSDAMGPVHYDVHEEHPFLGQRIATDGGTSDATVHAIEDEARKLLATALAAASSTIVANRDRLDRLVESLLDHETLEQAQLAALLGPRVVRPNVVPVEAPVPPPTRVPRA